MRAEERDLDYIGDMQIVTNASKYKKDPGADPILVAFGAHYSKRMVPREDILLHIIKEVRSMPNPAKQYSVVYFHASTQLPKKPAVGFFKSLHVALGLERQAQCDRIKAIYIVHPSPLLRTWLLTFQLRIDPDLFKRVVYVSSLVDLQRYFAEDTFAPLPQHVKDEDTRRALK